MPVSMLTTEIAEVTGKRHDHVMRDTRKMLAELHGAGGPPKFGESYRNAQGKAQPCFRLPKHELLVLLTGYSTAMLSSVRRTTPGRAASALRIWRASWTCLRVRPRSVTVAGAGECSRPERSPPRPETSPRCCAASYSSASRRLAPASISRASTRGFRID